jgi:DNA-binding response OmpR family regulator
MGESRPLHRRRVLLVEDEFLLAITVENDLKAAGADIAGPYHTLQSALAATDHERFDCAVLDVNLGDAMVYPLADELASRSLPFLFLSGYSTEQLPARFAKVPRLSKPYRSTALVAAILALFEPGLA